MKTGAQTGSSRREFLKQASLGGALMMTGYKTVAQMENQNNETVGKTDESYKYRIGFGAWINDLRNQPLPLQNWPAPQFDDVTLEGAVRTLDVMSEAGYGYLDVFGLWATGDYPPDIVSAFQDADRRERLQILFREAAQRNIRMVLPLGLFTWGYDRIIREDPEVCGKTENGSPHAHAMCGAKEKSWTYIEKLIDTAMNQYDFSAVHMESADLGWCMCSECSGKYGTVGYNCRLNMRAADYIKGKWPHVVVYTIPINWIPWRLTENGQQQKFSREEFEHILELSHHIDILMDQGHRGNYVPPEWIPELHCSYGTSGGLWVYHSVRMHRLSYLLPYPRRTCQLLKRDYEQGARACLNYQGPMINPAVEINSATAGRIMNDINRDPIEILEDVVEKYHRPRSSQARQKLAGIYCRIEDGYFGRWNADAIKKAHNLDVPGEFSGWGLFGEEPEMPNHFAEPFLDKEGRLAYKNELIGCLRDLEMIRESFDDRERIERLMEALLLSVQFLKVYIAYKG